MRLCVIQMDMRLGESAYNFAHAEALLRRAAAEGTDTALLPETWNTGFFPADHLPERSGRGVEAVKALCAPLARELNMNIVAGSVSDRRGGRVYNTAYVFDRQGACLAAYDKTHLFTPMGEHEHYAAGDHLTTFSLDGHKCGLLICYDLRFPELFRTLALQGVELLLLPAQWPAARRYHWETLTAARAIETSSFWPPATPAARRARLCSAARRASSVPAASCSPPPERARRSSPPRSIFPSLRRSATPSTSFTTVGRSYIVSEIKRRTETAGSRGFFRFDEKNSQILCISPLSAYGNAACSAVSYACRRDRGAALLPLHFVISIPMKIKEL